METRIENYPFFSKSKIIDVFAFDFDKCIFSELYLKMIEHCLEQNPEMTWSQFLDFQKDIIDSKNHYLLQKITGKILKHKDTSKVRLVSSSGRQSYKDDLINRYTGPVKTGSSLQALLLIKALIEQRIDTLGENVKIKVNYFLLADLYADLTHGTSYQNALIEMQNFSLYWRPGHVNEIALSTTEHHPTWLFDDSKFTIVYSHIHEFFSTKKNLNMLRYYMVDDRLDILENLKQFILNAPGMLVKGSIIILIHYCGKELTKIGTVSGDGVIDFRYDESVKKMLEISGASIGDSRIFNVLTSLNHSDNLELFLEWQSEVNTNVENIAF